MIDPFQVAEFVFVLFVTLICKTMLVVGAVVQVCKVCKRGMNQETMRRMAASRNFLDMDFGFIQYMHNAHHANGNEVK